jgi:hypothetical protein
MILKEKDSIDKNLEQLEKIARLPELPKATITRIEKEIKFLKSGDKGEQDSAYWLFR